jgi:hypothetical protein
MPMWVDELPGRLAGRQVDGVEWIIDGVSHGWHPPLWEEQLAELGWDRGRDGPPAFQVRVAQDPRARCHADVRSALRDARSIVETGTDCWRVAVVAVTRTGLQQEVVTGRPVVGMAIGATEDEQLRTAEGPAWLPPFPPGEEPPRRHRYRIGRKTKPHA